MVQQPWACLNGFFTHLLCLKVIWDTAQHHGLSSTALSHITWVLRQSGTQSSAYGLPATASSHIFTVLKQSGTCTNERSSMGTASSRILSILTCSEASFHSGTFINRDILIYITPGWYGLLPSENPLPGHQRQEGLYLYPQFFCISLFVLRDTPIP